MRQVVAARNKKVDILKDKTLEIQWKEFEEAHYKHTSVYAPQSFQNKGDSDSEEPEEGTEEDPEEEPEEDPEEGPEEDPEEGPEEDPEEGPEEDPEEELEEDLELGLEETTNKQKQGELIKGPKVEPEDDKEEDSSEEQCKRLAVDCAAPLKSRGGNFSAEQPTEHEDDDPSAECVFEPTETAYQNSLHEKQRIMVNTAEHPLSQNYGPEKNRNYGEAVKDEFNIKYNATDQYGVPAGLEAVVDDENSGEQANSGKRRHSRWDQDPETDQKTVAEDGKCKKRKTRWDADDSKSGSLLDWEVLAKRNAIVCKELYILVKEYPTYNFIGLILGPKGNTQKRMEMESGAKIPLRGKGSSKLSQEGDPSKEKDLHVCIEAVSQKSLDAAVSMVEKLLIPVEDGMNDHKRAQLQELSSLKEAAINNSCSVCKETGHNILPVLGRNLH